jgi:hypothetical protein
MLPIRACVSFGSVRMTRAGSEKIPIDVAFPEHVTDAAHADLGPAMLGMTKPTAPPTTAEFANSIRDNSVLLA